MYCHSSLTPPSLELENVVAVKLTCSSASCPSVSWDSARSASSSGGEQRMCLQPNFGSSHSAHYDLCWGEKR